MEKKLSVIIPVYNVEKYLPECLDSVVGQSLQEIELICVNDGSRDGSRNILSEYAEKDNRITILDKPNGGLSSARNAGLAVAEALYPGHHPLRRGQKAWPAGGGPFVACNGQGQDPL